MRTVLLLTQRRPVAQSLMRKMRNTPDVRLLYEHDYTEAETSVLSDFVGVILVEIAESGKYDTGFCLALCNRIRMKAPGCKLLLLCPEQDEIIIAAAIEAKRDGHVDDFLFCDATIDFIMAKILSFLSV